MTSKNLEFHFPGGPWRVLGGSLGRPPGVLGGPRGVLGGPRGVLGRPRGGPRGVLGRHRKQIKFSEGARGGSRGAPGVILAVWGGSRGRPGRWKC